MNYVEIGGVMVPQNAAESARERVSEIEQRDNLIAILETQNFALSESFAQLERDMTSQGMMKSGTPVHEFSKQMIDRAAELSRAMYVANPLINNVVSTKANYVFGRGVTQHANDPDIDAVLQEHQNDPSNRAAFYDHQEQIIKEVELECDGNWFIMLFEDEMTGRTQLRFAPLIEIKDVERDPDDRARVRFYKRQWTIEETDAETGEVTRKTNTAWHPDWRYTDNNEPPTFGKHPVMWDQPIYHVKVGAFSDWKFGLSEVFCINAWARAQKEMLETCLTVSQAKAKIAAQMTTPGGAKGAKVAAKQLGGATGALPHKENAELADGANANPKGGVLITPEGVKYQTINTGTAGNVDEIKLFRQQVAAGAQQPETFFGAADMGNHATAKSLARPVEFNFSNRQMLHKIVRSNIIERVFLNAVKAPQGKLKSLGHVVPDEDGVERVVWNEGIDATIKITFPTVVEQDENLDSGQATAATDLVTRVMSGELAATVARPLLSAMFPNIGSERVDALFKAIEAEQEKTGKTGENATEAKKRKVVEPGVIEPWSKDELDTLAVFDLADVETMLKTRTPAMQKLLLAREANGARESADGAQS